MPVLAIAKINRVKEVRGENGWSRGWRLIDTRTEEIRDISDEVLHRGLANGIKVANLFLNDNGRIQLTNWDDESLAIVSFPKIAITKSGEHEIPDSLDTQKRIFVLSSRTIRISEITTLMRVCTPLGTDIKTVCNSEIKYYNVMNHFGGVYLGEAAKDLDIDDVVSEEAREIMHRRKLLRLPMYYLTDSLSEGVTFAKLADDGPLENVDIDIPDCVTEIAQGAIGRRPNILYGKIRLGRNVKILHSNSLSFARASGLSLNTGLEYIDRWAFSHSTVHGDIEIPEGVKYIASDAFSGVSCVNFIIRTTQVEPPSKDLSKLNGWEFINTWYITGGFARNLVIRREVANILLGHYLLHEIDWRRQRRTINLVSDTSKELDRIVRSKEHLIEEIEQLTDYAIEDMLEYVMLLLTTAQGRVSVKIKIMKEGN